MTDRMFMGMPVSGDIYEVHRDDQRPVSELQPVFQALIEHPKVVDFGWVQYTPYFNDGDTCEFGVHEPWLRTIDDVDPDDEYFDYYDFELFGHPTLGNMRWDSEALKYMTTESKHPDVTELFVELHDIQKGCYESDLINTFGDHAMITVTKSGITVDAYSHE